ncbi:MAG: SEC-C metal-binding domain-containing protein, partial [Angustibacter sp.]
FSAMNEAIKEESVGYLFHLEVEVEEPQDEAQAPAIAAKGLVAPQRPSQLQYTAPSVDVVGGVESRAEELESGAYPGTAKNAPCPCGSGKKYKRCHGA